MPGYRPGEISLFETSKSADANTNLSSEIIPPILQLGQILLGFDPEQQILMKFVTGHFQRLKHFLNLENICQSRWQATNKLSNSGSSSTRLGFQFSIDILQGNPLELDELSLAILTVEKVNALDFTESYGRTLTDWVDRPNDGLSNLNLRNIIPLSQILTSNTCDGTESAACVDSVSYERVR